MNRSVFERLEKIDKEMVLRETGEIIEITTHGYYDIVLYGLYSFFVEVVQRKRDSVIIEISSFEDGNKLDYYTKGKKL